MREVLINQYGYSLNDIPVSLGGSCDPTADADVRYQACLSTVTNSQSICYPYYTQEYQAPTTRSNRNILFLNTDHHPHHHSNQETSSLTSPSTVSSPNKIFAIVTLRKNHDSSQTSARKRESSSSNDSEKRHRTNDSIIEEEPSPLNPLTIIPQEISIK